VELLGLVAYVAAAGGGGGVSPASPMLTKLHALLAGCADRGAAFPSDPEQAMLAASRDALRMAGGTGSASSPLDRARAALLRGGR
jgi:hypothetical protein